MDLKILLTLVLIGKTQRAGTSISDNSTRYKQVELYINTELYIHSVDYCFDSYMLYTGSFLQVNRTLQHVT